jgi:glutamyl-tRNA reductase
MSSGKMEPLIKERIEEIDAMLLGGRADRIISDIYHRADKARSGEVAKAVSRLKPTREQEGIIERMSQSIVEKLLTSPVSSLLKAAERGDSQTLQLARQLFGGE